MGTQAPLRLGGLFSGPALAQLRALPVRIDMDEKEAERVGKSHRVRDPYQAAFADAVLGVEA